MKLYQLLYFVTVCNNHNNISRASEELHISQPSISTAIRELEDEFGVSLFHRVNRKLSITSEGEFFFTMASDLLSRSEDIISRMQDLGQQRNHIKIGVPPMIGSFLFPTIFQEFTRFYPDIQLEAFENGSLQIVKLMEEDVLDVAIITLNQTNLDHFYSANILDTEMVFCVNPDHPLAGRPSISFSELEGEPLVLLKSGSYQCQAVESALRDCGSTPNVVLHTNQLYTIEAFLHRGIASAFLFREVANRMTGIRTIPLTQPLHIHVGIIWKRGRFIYSDVARFISFVKKGGYLSLL